MKVKIPEIKKALDIVAFIETKKGILLPLFPFSPSLDTEENLKIDFLLTDTIYAHGKVKKNL